MPRLKKQIRLRKTEIKAVENAFRFKIIPISETKIVENLPLAITKKRKTTWEKVYEPIQPIQWRRYGKYIAPFMIIIFGVVNVLFPIGGTNSFFSDSELGGGIMTAGVWGINLAPIQAPATGRVVINEFLPDPIGDDADVKPNGEWMELFSTLSTTLDLAGYYLTDNLGHKIVIEPCRTDTGATTIDSYGFLVIYRNGGDNCTSHDFSLNNDGDTVGLHSPSDELIDSHAYSASDVAPGKSIARFPDGSDNWFDPIPTPGKPNQLEERPVIGIPENLSPVSSSIPVLGIPETGIEIVETPAPTDTPTPTATPELTTSPEPSLTPESSPDPTPEPSPEISQEPSSTPEPVIDQQPPVSEDTSVQTSPEPVVSAEPVNIEPSTE